MRYLALDFDGVVADSINECLATALVSFSRFQGGDRDLPELGSLPLALNTAFRHMRPLIRRGEDYVFLIQAFEEKVVLESQQQFDSYLEANEGRRDSYRQLFYSERARLQEEDIESWLDLNPLYPGMADFLRGFWDPASAFVVTTKDMASVQLVFSRYDIAIPDDNLFQATRSYRKPAILNQIITEHQIENEQLHFVDDHAATVLEVTRDSRATCYCAAWGYNTPEQLDTLQEMGVQALSLEEFFEKYTALSGMFSQ